MAGFFWDQILRGLRCPAGPELPFPQRSLRHPPNQAVVIDAGTKLLKAGLAIPDQPPAMVIPTQMKQVPEDESSSNASLLESGTVDPIVRGFISDWDAMEDLLSHVLYAGLGWEIGNEGQILFSDPLPNPKNTFDTVTKSLTQKYGEEAIDKDQVFYELAGGHNKKNEVYGIGSKHKTIPRGFKEQLPPAPVDNNAIKQQLNELIATVQEIALKQMSIRGDVDRLLGGPRNHLQSPDDDGIGGDLDATVF